MNDRCTSNITDLLNEQSEEEAPGLRHSSKLYIDRWISFQRFCGKSYRQRVGYTISFGLRLLLFKSGKLSWKWNRHYFCWGSFKRPEVGLLDEVCKEGSAFLLLLRVNFVSGLAISGEGGSFPTGVSWKIRIAAPAETWVVHSTKSLPVSL